MIVWVNGPFGVGKTTLAHALVDAPGAVPGAAEVGDTTGRDPGDVLARVRAWLARRGDGDTPGARRDVRTCGAAVRLGEFDHNVHHHRTLLRHLPLLAAATRLREALAPGGTLLVLGLAREGRPGTWRCRWPPCS